MFRIIIIIIIKNDWQCKAGRGRLTPYQSEDPSPTLPTYRGKEEKGKIFKPQKRTQQLGQQKGIGPALETRQSHTIEYGVNQIVMKSKNNVFSNEIPAYISYIVNWTFQ